MDDDYIEIPPQGARQDGQTTTADDAQRLRRLEARFAQAERKRQQGAAIIAGLVAVVGGLALAHGIWKELTANRNRRQR